MNKELKAFKEICKNLNSYEFSDEYKKNKELIETAFKALDIIKEKVQFEFLEEREEGKIIQRYFVIGNCMFPVTKEEYDLLKEILKDE